MGVEGCSRVMKYVLVIFNALVLICGGIAIGLGVWGLTSDYGGDKIKDLTGSELYRGACIAVIVGGSFIVILAGLGCLGSCLENRVMLGIYFVIMLLLLILFVVAAVLGFVFKDDIKDELDDQMSDSLKEKYGVNVDSDDDNKAATDVWDEIQEKLECCGVSGDLKSETSWFLWQSSQWFQSQLGLDKDFVPRSCCTDEAKVDFTLCQRENSDASQPVQTSVSGITGESKYLYSKGCIDALEDKIEDHIVAIAAIAVTVLVVMFLCIVFSICVCMEVGKQSMIV